MHYSFKVCVKKKKRTVKDGKFHTHVLVFSTLRNKTTTLGVAIRIKQQRLIVCKLFALFRCGHLGAVCIPCVQYVIFNLTHPYIRSTTVCTIILDV